MESKSSYLLMLEKDYEDVGRRYVDKIKIINYIDPFTIPEENLDYGIDALPPISSMDIVSYLVLTHSSYTAQQMKAYKSLEAYKYFEAGFVKMGCIKLDDFYVLVGKVQHSQRANEKPLNVWVITQAEGSVCTAHCTCMAGNSESCSHVAAVLFAAEFAHKIKEGTSCTDVKTAWPVPALTKVPVVPVSSMNWGIRTNKTEISCSSLTKEETVSLLSVLEEAGCSSALSRIVEPFASRLNLETTMLPNVFDIYKVEFESKCYEELLQIGRTLQFNFSAEDAVNIEVNTRNQSSSPEWYHQRSGRITASKFKMCCNYNKQQPSLSLIKTTCYPAKMKFSTKATSWGITHEIDAVKAYCKKTYGSHTDQTIKEVGLLIRPQHCQLGASPDRLISCACCGNGCLEVKCPYFLKKNTTVLDFALKKNTCLILENNKIILDKKHTYFYQTQLQMFVSDTKYCDFVVWSPRETFIERIYRDDEFLKINLEKALNFHSNVIIPELLGRYFTKKTGTGNVCTWCTCNGYDDETPMIKCSNDNCKFQWFHFNCIGIDEIPEEIWTCEYCKVDIGK